MSLAPPLRRTLLAALASLALTSLAAPSLAAPTAHAKTPWDDVSAAHFDLRSPDARDAAVHAFSVAGTTSGDERSALAQERSYSSYTHPVPRSQQPASASPSGDGIAPLPFLLGIVGALLVGLVAGSGLHLVHTRRRHATRLAT